MRTAEERVQQLIARIEPYARRRPRLLRARVAAIAVSAYLAFAIYLLLLAFLTPAFGLAAIRRPIFLTISVAIGALVDFAYSVSSLRVRLKKPEGFPLKHEDAWNLRSLADELTWKLHGPRIQEILISNDYNPGVSQFPRLGVFGWQKNYLIVGLTLVCALTPEEFRGILAHEFGHLSGNHGRFSGWLCRVRKTWVQMAENLETRAQKAPGGQAARGVVSVIAAGALKFLKWYLPIYDAHVFMMNRSHEYEADRAAAALVGAEVHGRALTRLGIRGRFLSEKFWVEVWRAARDSPDMPEKVFDRLAPAVREDLPEPGPAPLLQRNARGAHGIQRHAPLFFRANGGDRISDAAVSG
jgi:Zn-dependent protease with chaperone function